MIPVWLLPVLLRELLGSVIGAILIKKVTDQRHRTTRFLWQYTFCNIIIWPICAFWGQVAFDKIAMIIIVIGLFNSFAAYAHWYAQHISMSRASLYLIWDDVLAMILGYYILSEGEFLNNALSAGITLSLASAVFFVMYGSKTTESAAKTPASKNAEVKFLLCVLVFSVTWGIAVFSMKYFGIQNVHPLKYLWAWYSGSLLGALTLFLTDKEPKGKMALKDLQQIFCLSACIVSSLGFAYWAYFVAPLIVMQPIFLVSEMIVPTLIGLYLFKEIKGLDANEKTLLFLGALGGFLIALNS